MAHDDDATSTPGATKGADEDVDDLLDPVTPQGEDEDDGQDAPVTPRKRGDDSDGVVDGDGMNELSVEKGKEMARVDNDNGVGVGSGADAKHALSSGNNKSATPKDRADDNCSDKREQDAVASDKCAAVGEIAAEGGATAEGEVAVESALGTADGDESRVGDKKVSMPTEVGAAAPCQGMHDNLSLIHI